MNIRKLDHVSFLVKDVERSRRFYGQVLGPREIPRPSNASNLGAWLTNDEHSFEVHLIEETYYHHIQPADGFAFQRVYNYEGFDETVAVHDGDLVLVPRGYHTVAALPRCDLYYLNIMAGPHRVWNYQVDPAFHRLLPPSGKITGSIVRPAAKEG